jgi:hypothetical protein
MRYKIAIVGFILFFIGFILSNRAYNFVCGCATPNLINSSVNASSSCYQCMNSTVYQNDMLFFQLIMIPSVFVVLYGFFSEFDYGENK